LPTVMFIQAPLLWRVSFTRLASRQPHGEDVKFV
jgi:hypothetical protein